VNFDDLPRSPSYYELLGVPANAELAALKKAFRAAARQHHPDRGGSHEQMVKLNAAYLVLSSPGSRAAYDSWLGAESEPASDRRGWEGTREARESAEEYPEEWEAFVEWLERTAQAVAEDWKDAELKASSEPSHFGLHFPNPGDSCSGMLAVGIGGVFGLALGVAAVSALGGFGVPIVFITVWLGAWAGILAHSIVRGLLSISDMQPQPDTQSRDTETPPGPPPREKAHQQQGSEEEASRRPPDDDQGQPGPTPTVADGPDHPVWVAMETFGGAIGDAVQGVGRVAGSVVKTLGADPESGCLPVTFFLFLPILPVWFVVNLANALLGLAETRAASPQPRSGRPDAVDDQSGPTATTPSPERPD
jgi:hypothetical protein